MTECNCCYCQSKHKPEKPEYIRGIKFAVEYVLGEYESLKQGVDRCGQQLKSGSITGRTYRSRTECLHTQMRYLGEWYDILAKEANKELKLIKDLDWKETLYGDDEK